MWALPGELHHTQKRGTRWKELRCIATHHRVTPELYEKIHQALRLMVGVHVDFLLGAVSPYLPRTTLTALSL